MKVNIAIAIIMITLILVIWSDMYFDGKKRKVVENQFEKTVAFNMILHMCYKMDLMRKQRRKRVPSGRCAYSKVVKCRKHNGKK